MAIRGPLPPELREALERQARRGRRRVRLWTPTVPRLEDLVRVEEGGAVLVVCAPLSLALNRILELSRLRGSPRAPSLLDRHWGEAKRFTSQLVAIALRGIRRRPWAEAASLSIVRCSMGPKTLDADTLTPGLKPLIDASWRAGLLADDDQAHLVPPIEVDDRRRGHWGELAGPGTWMTWRSLR